MQLEWCERQTRPHEVRLERAVGQVGCNSVGLGEESGDSPHSRGEAQAFIRPTPHSHPLEAVLYHLLVRSIFLVQLSFSGKWPFSETSCSTQGAHTLYRSIPSSLRHLGICRKLTRSLNTGKA